MKYRILLEIGEFETAADMPNDARINITGGAAMPLMADVREGAAPGTKVQHHKDQ